MMKPSFFSLRMFCPEVGARGGEQGMSAELRTVQGARAAEQRPLPLWC